MILLGGILAVAMGAVLGLLGGGGSILAVPILLYVFALPAKQAIATSLLVVGATSVAALLQHARAGRVRWSTGISFAAFAMCGAYAGGRLAGWVPGRALLALFVAMMLFAARRMLCGGRAESEAVRAPRVEFSLLRVGAQGIAVGLLTGMVGAGGGFLIVPALVLLTGLPMREAIGTSLLVISLNSAAALAGYLDHVSIDATAATVATAGAVAGAMVGSLGAGRVAASRLRRIFAWLVLSTGAAMATRELVAAGAPPLAIVAVIAAALAAGLTPSGGFQLARLRQLAQSERSNL